MEDYEEVFSKEIRCLVMSHIDRMKDYCREDSAERILDSFVSKFDPIFEKYLKYRPRHNACTQVKIYKIQKEQND